LRQILTLGYYWQADDWAVRDAPIIAELTRLVEDRPTRGFRKFRKLLSRQGHARIQKRSYRMYKPMRLYLRRAAKRPLPTRERLPLYVPRLARQCLVG
jgi:putative transposase